MDGRMEARTQGNTGGESPCACGMTASDLPATAIFDKSQPCCGSPPGPPSDAMERPGYRLWHFVDGFAGEGSMAVPRVKTRLERADRFGAVSVRLGGVREDYRVAPGLYCTGEPGPDSVVLVTANYKLSFDSLRKELTGLDAWILVLDTRGINVWCAAGKGIFGTDEVIRQVKYARLEERVKHRNLVLPQLGATGVSARMVLKGCGFHVVWGPVRAGDLKAFLDAGMKADPAMRRVTFTTAERTVLVPVEVAYVKKAVPWVLLAIFVLSGIGPHVFSIGDAWSRGIMGALALFAGILSGAVLTPLLLPWIPGRAFSGKGALIGCVVGLAAMAFAWSRVGALAGLGVLLITVSLGSFLAMNFTGATPFTSPTGVEKEMRRAMPLQAAALLAAVVIWVGSAFV